MKANHIFLLKNTLAMVPFTLNAIFVMIATYYAIDVPASIVALSTVAACILSADSLAKIREKAQAKIKNSLEKYSTKDDYFEFYNSIFAEVQHVTSCQDYLDKSEELFSYSKPFRGKKVYFYYEKGTLYKRIKAEKEFTPLCRRTIENNFSTWRKTKEN